MPNIESLKKYKRIHMIGIGGISMSGIAEILKHWGFIVTGSDHASSEMTEHLIANGIPVVIGHDINCLKQADIVIYTAAIPPTDEEFVKAKEFGIPTVERSQFLGYITKAFEDTICISGTHGKTTTTSMISMCFLEAGKDPSIQVGATLKAIDGNYRMGSSEYFILEACEYVESFLKFYPKAEVILNIDNDHLDYFKNIENINQAFINYVKLLPEDGLLIVNTDNTYCQKLHKYTSSKVVSYALENEKANYIARNITFNKNGFARFDIYHNNCFYGSIELSVPGMHNVSNSLACVALCDSYGIAKSDIKTALKKYTGAHRRFEFIGKINGATIYDDYGHHPTEIQATSMALQKMNFHKSWVVFQPHTYSRTKNNFDDFVNSLMLFDHVIVTDIYAAREENTYAISSKDIVEKLQSMGKKATYFSSFKRIVTFLKKNVKQEDVILTLGAGNVTEIGPMLLEKVD